MVVLLGARQTGKTTLVRSLAPFARRPYLTLDDFDLRVQAAADPEAVLERAPALVLDEVQRARDLLIAVKRAVDRDRPRKPGRFVLTGSANLLMLERIGETLVGRAVYVTLWPFTRRERHGLGRAGAWSELLGARFSGWREVLAAHAGPREDWRAAARLGGFPVPAHELASDEARSLWFSGYVQTYLERDLQALRAVENLPDFRRLMRAACLRIGGRLNQAELGRDVQPVRPEILYWRTAAGQEVDFVIETPKRLLPIEVKAAARVTPADARGLEAFLDEYGRAADGALLLYGGSEAFPLTRHVRAVPWWMVC